MTIGSGLEVNFTRLLSRCELLVKSYDVDSFDKKLFGKYVETLRRQFTELRSGRSGPAPSQAALSDFSRRLDSLTAVEQQKPPPSVVQRLLFERAPVAPAAASSEGSSSGVRRRGAGAASSDDSDARTDAADDGAGLGRRSLSSESAASASQRATGLGEAKRQAGTAASSAVVQDIEESVFAEIMEQNARKQETYTADMVVMARSMKEKARLATDILAKDNTNLDTLDTVAEANLGRVKQQNETLRDYGASSSSFTLSLWVLMVCVLLIFMATYGLMKMFPNR
eukprot:TRINITY_DN31701_c0_g1_i1.p2 TRINITY_DN31701_c0_g1~~TRINITY_DN31701_c0_g1_i1.p2  ORF type:complete len:290 (-),score=98.19 TRINITY_DN31701_c0_g1_i1:99-947(-)